MKNYFKIALILAFGILIFFQVKSFASKNAQLKSLLLQREIQSLEIQTRFSMALEAPDKEFLSNKLVSLYTAVIEDPNSARNDKLKAKESLAELMLVTGQKDKAYNLALEVLNEQPRLYLSSTILFAIADKQANEYLNKRQYDEAIFEYQDVLRYPLREGYLAAAEFSIARIYAIKKDPDSAIKHYESLISNYPFAYQWPSGAKYSIAKIYISKKDYKKAKEELEELVTVYPNSSWSELGRAKLKELSVK